MSSFTVDLTSPLSVSTFRQGYGGPNVGGHHGPHWYIQYGMDLGADAGSPVYAAFDAHVTRYTPHDPAADSGTVYGAQIFMRDASDRMGAFYTHLTDVPDGLGPGSAVALNDYLGTGAGVAGIPPHVHMALVEIVGGAPDGTYQGVDLYAFFLDISGGEEDVIVPVTFFQELGMPPLPKP